MKTTEFKTVIKAPRNIVWHALWSDDSYRKWTSAFAEGSHTISDWQEGSEIKFLGPNGNGGMYSIIHKKTEPSYMAFKHLGEIKDGKKQAESDWAGAMETYTLNEKDKETELIVSLDMTEEFLDYFNNTWPIALKKLKEIAEDKNFKAITIEAKVNAPVDKVWKFWTEPSHVVKWNNASEDWYCPKAENDVKEGGKFSFTMAAKDGSFSFDFGGDYNKVKQNELIGFTMGDGRKVNVSFSTNGKETSILETFEAETENSMQMQKEGWQAILNNFKKYVESN